jgi:hypothetical protein
MAETALIGLDVDLSLINRRLAEAGDLTAKEARHMQGELVRAFKHSARASEDAAKQMARATGKAARDAERDAKKAAREVESSIKGQASAVRGLFTAALGGVGGDMLDLADATEGASDQMAALGLAFGALTIGPELLGRLALGMIDLANAGVEAKNSLEEAGIAVENLVSAEALAALTEYEKQAKLTDQINEVMAVRMGGAAAKDAQIFSDSMLAAKLSMTSASEAGGGFFATIGKISEKTIQYSTLEGKIFIKTLQALGEVVGKQKAEMAQLVREEERLAEEAAAATASMEDQKAALIALGMLTEEETTATTKSTAALDRQRAAYERRLAALNSQLQALRDEKTTTEEGTVEITTHADAVAALEQAYLGTQSAIGITDEQAKTMTETFRQLNEEVAAGGEDELSPMQQFAEDMEEASRVANLVAGSITPIINNVATLASIEQRQHEDRVDQLRTQRAESRETYQDALREFQENRDAMTDHERAVAEFELEQLKMDEEKKRELIREREKEAKKSAREGFKRTQALQIAAAAVESARNAIALTAAYIPVAGPYAPIVATGVAAAQLATQIAIIKSTPPPKFHFGTGSGQSGGQGPSGIPGAEFVATLEQGEGVVSRRGMATPGMEELVAMVNSGQAPTMQRSVSDTEADLLARRLNRPYAPSIRGRAQAGRNTFYRGR